MSNRSLLEFNHDLGPRDDDAACELGYALQEYMRTGEKVFLPRGVTFVQMRHHSDPAPNGWQPPQDRKNGYDCLGFMGGRWCVVYWDEQPFHKNPRPFWRSPGSWGMTWDRQNQPTHFLPMPEPPHA